MTYRMRITTEGQDGKARTETIENIPADQVQARRDAARLSAPQGVTRTIKVHPES